MKNTLFAIGEALIDFIPDKTGCDFGEVSAFSPKVGGAPANVLGAFSLLGGKTQLLTQVGDDPFGHKIKDEPSNFGIGLKYFKMTDKANTALAFVSLANNGDRTFSFYRNPSADMLYSEKNITSDMFSDCFALHFCSVSLGDFPMREAHKRAIKLARENDAVISFDPNLRFPLWKDKTALKNAVSEFLPLADIVKISDNELSFITGTDDAAKGCKILLKTAKIVICTCGGNGAYAFSKNASVFSKGENVKAVDTTGAGDAFCGSFLYNLYRNNIGKSELSDITKERLQDFLNASNAYCAKSIQKYGAIASYSDKL